jgi:AcrR family transcriptional regulator
MTMETRSTSYCKIIKAAYGLFLTKGIDSTSTKEIAKAAKVNEVTIFRLFKTKKDLAAEIIAEHGPGSVIAKFDSLALGDDQEKNLTALTLTMNKYYDDNKLFMKFIFNNLTTKKNIPHLHTMLDPILVWLDRYLTKYTTLSKKDQRHFAVEFCSVIAMRSMRRALIDTTLPFEEDDKTFAKFHARLFAGALRDLTNQGKE